MNDTDIFLDRVEGRSHKGYISLGLLYTSDPFFVGERIIRKSDGKIFLVTDNVEYSNGTFKNTVEEYNGMTRYCRSYCTTTEKSTNAKCRHMMR